MSFKISLMIVFAMTLLGCIRATSDKIKVGISLPSVKSENGAQSNQTLQHVIINITGSGMEPYLFTWDAHNATGSTNQFSFEFDSGTQRLVQALAVYVDTSTEMMSFYYGDANADFTNSSVNISLPIIKLDSGYNASGNISGRYLTSDTGGPTGPVKVTYKPSGKPEMIIERSYIYNGWFNLFGLSDVEFTYSLNDGTVLFGGPTKLLGSSRIPDNSDTVLKLQVPLRRRSKGDGTYEQSEPRVRVYGWFFDLGVSSTVQAGKKICKGTFGSTLPSFIKYSGTTDPLSLLSQTGLEPSSSQFDAVSGTSLVTQGKAL